MAKKIATNVVGIHAETGEPRWFRRGDTVPEAYQASITNPAAYEDIPDEQPEPALTLVKDDDELEPEEDEDLIGEEEEYEDNYEAPGVTNDDLRAELARRDLPLHGNKADLIARLREDDASG